MASRNGLALSSVVTQEECGQGETWIQCGVFEQAEEEVGGEAC